MKKILFKIALSAFAIFGFASAAHAVNAYSNSVKYFDEAGRVVGQQILFCGASSKHGGNIHTAYNIAESYACGPFTPPTIIVPGTQIVSYTLPGSLTISQACGLAQCVDAGIQPMVLNGVSWTYSSGWQ